MLLVCGGQTSEVIAGSIGVENHHIKIGILASVPKSYIKLHVPHRQCCSLKVSPDNGCRGGLIATFGQTSVSSDAVMSLDSSWHSVEKLPHGKPLHDQW